MRFKTSVWAILVLAAATVESQSAPAHPAVVGNYGRLPLTFEANQGQSASQVKFISRGPGYSAYLTSDGMSLSLRASHAELSPTLSKGGTPHARQQTKVGLQFKLVGANPNPAVLGEAALPGRVNYFMGNDPHKWRQNIPTYAQVRYKNVYRGIDLVYYGNNQQLEYDFSLAPNADPQQIRFEIKGARRIGITKEGSLSLQVAGGELHFQAPIVYQESNGQRIPVKGAYVLTDASHVGFRVANYNSNKTLVIDPVLVYSTYLGGNGSEQPYGIAVDATGNVYVSGSTDSTDFPLTTIGDPSSSNPHVFVAKLDPTGSNLIYADYLGGSIDDYGFGVAIDASNNVYLTGCTASSDFPMVQPFQRTYPGNFNAFLSKISADGSSLLYSTYFGGNGSDIPAGIAVDAAGEMIIAGSTSSTNIPLANPYQASAAPNQGNVYGQYGFLTKFTADGSSLVYSTYFGGSSNVPYNCGASPCWTEPYTSIAGLAIDQSGNAYVDGDTNTYNFPVTQNAYQATNSTPMNASVGFVGKFDGSGTLQYSTYFYETSGLETSITGIAVDSMGSAYITGAAASDGTFPVTTTSICDPGSSGAACGYAFVTKFDATGSTLLYSTFLGPNNNAVPQAIAIDGNGDAYVAAVATGSPFTTVNPIESYSQGNDLLLVEIDPAATTQLLATYVGGTGDDEPVPAGMSVDANGNIYILGMTDSSDFPVTPTAYQAALNANTDSFILKIRPASGAAVTLSPVSLQFGDQQVGTSSQPQTVLLRNMGSAALSISSITAAGDFTETDNCATSVPAASSCQVAITFSPTVPGSRTGSISIQDAVAGSTQSINLIGSATGPAVALAPQSLTFSGVTVGSSSAFQTITLTNSGNQSLAVSGIAVSGSFTQTNNCPSNLAAMASCSINVTFTPSASGTSAGAITITDNATGGLQTVALTGTTSAISSAVLSPQSLTFNGVIVGTASATQTVTLASNGTQALSISGISVSGSFAETNNCPTSLAVGSTCSISVSFDPNATGTTTGALTVSDNASGGSQSVSLSGTASSATKSDFNITGFSTSATITVGATATYTLSVNPVGGSFTNAVKLSCSGAPASSTCSFSQPSVTPGASSKSFTVTVTTAGASAQIARPAHGDKLLYAVFMQLQGFGLFGMFLTGSKGRNKKFSKFLLLALLIGALLFMSACAGGTGIAKQSTTGTPSGTYTVTVTGVSGTLQHSLPLTLTVQ
jgi:hypothetical protein